MKTTLTIAVLFTFLMVGCSDDSTSPTFFDSEFSQNSNLPNWIQLPDKEGVSVENQFSVMKNIEIKLYQEVI